MNGQHIYTVVNAGCRDKDLAHLSKHLAAAKVCGAAGAADGGGAAEGRGGRRPRRVENGGVGRGIRAGLGGLDQVVRTQCSAGLGWFNNMSGLD